MPTTVPEDRSERQQYVQQQLQQTARWHNAGSMAYKVLLFSLLSFCTLVLCLFHHTENIALKHVFSIFCCIVLVSYPLGNLIGLPMARRKLRYLITQLHESGNDPWAVLSTMAKSEDSSMRDVADEGLRLLATEGVSSTASKTLVRASDPPSMPQNDVLLRPVAPTDTLEVTEQLLRPGSVD